MYIDVYREVNNNGAQTRKRERKMKYEGRELEMLGDDGNGSRLWLDVETDLVANESYNQETGESHGLNANVMGWGYSAAECLL